MLQAEVDLIVFTKLLGWLLAELAGGSVGDNLLVVDVDSGLDLVSYLDVVWVVEQVMHLEQTWIVVQPLEVDGVVAIDWSDLIKVNLSVGVKSIYCT